MPQGKFIAACAFLNDLLNITKVVAYERLRAECEQF